MRKLMLAAGALALSISVPALGQTEQAKAGPDDDLRCAAWAGLGAGVYKDDPQMASGFAIALAWFIARFEGATGKPFEEAMTPDYLNGLQPELQVIQDACLPRMREMSDRLTNWGAALRNAGE